MKRKEILFGVMVAAALTASASAPTLTLEWKNTNVPTANDTRQAVAMNGKFYVQNRPDGKVYVYDQNGLTGTSYASASASAITRDAAGNIVVRLNGWASAWTRQSWNVSTPNLRIISANGSTTADVSITGLPDGNCDFIGTASGNLLSASGGVLYVAINGQTKVYACTIANGAFVSCTAMDMPIHGHNNPTTADGTSIVNAFTDANGQSRILLWVRSAAPALFTLASGNTLSGDGTALTLTNKDNSNGAAMFPLGGKNFIVYPHKGGSTNYLDGFAVGEVADNGVVTELITKAATVTAAPQSLYSNWLFAENISGVDDRVNIYQYYPGGYMAKYVFFYVASNTLAEVAAGNITGRRTISNNLTCVDISPDGTRLYCKDNGEYANPSVNSNNLTDYIELANLSSGAQDQSNWLEVVLPSALTTDAQFAQYRGHIVSGLDGTLSIYNGNITLTAKTMPTPLGTADYTPNRFIPCNFTSNHTGSYNNVEYFFVTPKPNECAMLCWVVYDADQQAFVVPQRSSGSSGMINAAGLQSAVPVNTSLVSGSFQNGLYYEQVPIIVKRTTAPAAAGRLYAPATGDFAVYPTDVPAATDIYTGLTTVGADNGKRISDVRYYTLMGQRVDRPENGVYIKQTMFTDGSITSQKVLNR